jgi:hypothetical protein
MPHRDSGKCGSIYIVTRLHPLLETGYTGRLRSFGSLSQETIGQPRLIAKRKVAASDFGPFRTILETEKIGMK